MQACGRRRARSISFGGRLALGPLALLVESENPPRLRSRVNGADGAAAAETTGLVLVSQPRDAACAAALLRHKRASEAGLAGPAFGDEEVFGLAPGVGGGDYPQGRRPVP